MRHRAGHSDALFAAEVQWKEAVFSKEIVACRNSKVLSVAGYGNFKNSQARLFGADFAMITPAMPPKAVVMRDGASRPFVTLSGTRKD